TVQQEITIARPAERRATRKLCPGINSQRRGPEVGLWEAHPADIPLAMPSLIPPSIASLAIVQRATSVPLVTRQLDNPSHFSELVRSSAVSPGSECLKTSKLVASVDSRNLVAPVRRQRY